MREPTSTRRQFLGLAGGAAVLGLPVVTLRPAEATPATLAAAIRNVVGEPLVKTGKVKLEVPPLVENGNTVPMTVSVASPMTPEDHVKSIHVFNEKNPQPNIGNFYLGPQRRPRAGLDPHPARRHPEGRGDRATVRRLVLVGQRRCRRDAGGLHRGGDLMAVRPDQRAGQGQARRGHRDQDADVAHHGDRLSPYRDRRSRSRATSSRASPAATTATRFSAPTCSRRSRPTRSSLSSRSRPRAASSSSNGSATRDFRETASAAITVE